MSKRILVVETDQALSRVLCDNFAFDGFEVLSVGDGADVEAAARRFAPDLVVLDAALPAADPSRLLAWLREELHTPVIQLSTRGRGVARPVRPVAGSAPDGVPATGASELVAKPFDLVDLLERVRALLACPTVTT
jgi:two-component system, OmpR family, response regulator